MFALDFLVFRRKRREKKSYFESKWREIEKEEKEEKRRGMREKKNGDGVVSGVGVQ